jgi:hypothetical protein
VLACRDRLDGGIQRGEEEPSASRRIVWRCHWIYPTWRAWLEITDSMSIAVRSSPATPRNAVKNVGTRGLGEVTGPRARVGRGTGRGGKQGSRGDVAVLALLAPRARLWPAPSLLTPRVGRLMLPTCRCPRLYSHIAQTSTHRSRGAPLLVLGLLSPRGSRNDTAALLLHAHCLRRALPAHHSSTLLSAQSLQDPRPLSRCSPAREHSTEFHPPWHSSRPSAR